jgi:hypothetical protein
MRTARPTAAQLDRGLAATWGDPTPPAAERPRMKLVGWKSIRKGNLVGFATVVLPVGLKLVDCPVFVGPSGPWAALPSKPLLDKDGRPRSDANGKRAFVQLLEWRDRGLSDRFSAALVELLRRERPGVFEGAS